MSLVVACHYHSFGAPGKLVTEWVLIGRFRGWQGTAKAIKFHHSSTKSMNGINDPFGRHVIDSGIQPAFIKNDDSSFAGLAVERFHFRFYIRSGHHVFFMFDAAFCNHYMKGIWQQAHHEDMLLNQNIK